MPKERIPAIVSGELGQLYFQKKIDKKNEKERLKQERAAERERKKEEKMKENERKKKEKKSEQKINKTETKSLIQTNLFPFLS